MECVARAQHQAKRRPRNDDDNCGPLWRHTQGCDQNGNHHINGNITTSDSDSPTSPQVSVRDMIRRYNYAVKGSPGNNGINSPRLTRSRQKCSSARPSKDAGWNYGGCQHYNGPHNMAEAISALPSPASVRGFITQFERADSGALSERPSNCHCKCQRCAGREEDSAKCVSSPVRSATTDDNWGFTYSNGESAIEPMQTNGQGSANNNSMKVTGSKAGVVCKPSRSTNRSEGGELCPTESSHQSMTTIAKTENGVRITIEIFFDQQTEQHQDSAASIVGNRVVTDIPPSRILAEFQQQVIEPAGNEPETDVAATDDA